MEQLVPTEIKYSLRRARWLVIAAALLPALLLALIAIDTFARSARQDQTAIHWMRALDLCAPAFRTSGTPQRHAAALPPGIDLRLTPWIGGPDRSYGPANRDGDSP